MKVRAEIEIESGPHFWYVMPGHEPPESAVNWIVTDDPAKPGPLFLNRKHVGTGVISRQDVDYVYVYSGPREIIVTRTVLNAILEF